MGRHEPDHNLDFLSVPTASSTDLELSALFMPGRSSGEPVSASKLETCQDFWQTRSCFDASQELSDYDALEPLLSEPVGTFEGLLASAEGDEPVLEGSVARLSSGSPSLEAAESEPVRTGRVQKARERNKRAQRTFRQRQKAKAQQQEEELDLAASRIAELEEQAATLQQLLAADLEPVGDVAASLQSPASGMSSIAARISASTCALQLEKHISLAKEQQLYQLLQQRLNSEGLHSASTFHFQQEDLPADTDPTAVRTEVMSARQDHLQLLKPCAAWEGCTPVPLEDLYSSILHGRLDLRLPLANARAPDRVILVSRLVAMPVKQHLQLQGHYCACLAKAAPFCEDPNSAHGKHFRTVMGEAMVLLAVFSECLPAQFLACLSISTVDGTSRMPQQTFEAVKTAASGLAFTADQLAATRALSDAYSEQMAAIMFQHHQQLTGLQPPAGTTGTPGPELSSPHQAASIKTTLARLANGCALQQEAYLHLTRTFVLKILTPYQAGMLCSASYPYLMEFPAVMSHVLSQSS